MYISEKYKLIHENIANHMMKLSKSYVNSNVLRAYDGTIVDLEQKTMHFEKHFIPVHAQETIHTEKLIEAALLKMRSEYLSAHRFHLNSKDFYVGTTDVRRFYKIFDGQETRVLLFRLLALCAKPQIMIARKEEIIEGVVDNLNKYYRMNKEIFERSDLSDAESTLNSRYKRIISGTKF